MARDSIPTLPTTAIRANSATAGDLLERAAELITDLAGNGHGESTGRDREVIRWMTDYTWLAGR